MPIMDGWEALKRIREDTRFASLPVLVLSAKGNPTDKVSAAELGATRYLKKPFDPKELSDVVKQMTG